MNHKVDFMKTDLSTDTERSEKSSLQNRSDILRQILSQNFENWEHTDLVFNHDIIDKNS